jgi:hypothetical protein
VEYRDAANDRVREIHDEISDSLGARSATATGSDAQIGKIGLAGHY